MSQDSTDELESIQRIPLTPLVPAKNLARTTTSRAAAGPSSKPASGATTAKRKVKQKPSTTPEVEEIERPAEVSSGDEGQVVAVAPTKSKTKKVTARSGSATLNGKPLQKGKGKSKADPVVESRKVAVPEPVDADELEIIDDSGTNAAIGNIAHAINTAAKSNKAGTMSRSTKMAGSREVERLQLRLSEVEAERDSYVAQLVEIHRVRTTEAEQLLDRKIEQYEARLSTQEQLIQELTTQLAQVEPLSRSGKSSVLHLVTRQSADEARQHVEKQLDHWKHVTEEKEIQIKDQAQIEEDLRYEIRVLNERLTALASKTSRNPTSGARNRVANTGGILGSDNPKNTEVIKFYEDLTNLLVCSMKFQPGKHLDLEESIFTCIFSYANLDDEGNSDTKSLNFTLRFCYIEGEDIPGPITSLEHLVASVEYTPLELDKESPEFVQKLDYLNSPFTFQRNQLPLFIRTLYSKLSENIKDESDDDAIYM